MKKIVLLLLCLLLPMACALAQEDAPANLSYEPEEFIMAAVGCRLFIPAHMTGYEGDMAAQDTGFRLSLEDDALGFSMSARVECGRDLPLGGFAAFYAERNGYGAAVESELGGFPVVTMTKSDDKAISAVLVGLEDQDSFDSYYYALVFDCENEKATALMNEILSTLTMY